MWLASKKITPPLEWHHNSKMFDLYFNTVAMILASNGIIPPKEWEHDKTL